jgi:hypothetical protein
LRGDLRAAEDPLESVARGTILAIDRRNRGNRIPPSTSRIGKPSLNR